MSYENDMFPMTMHYETPAFSLPITHMTMAINHISHTNYCHTASITESDSIDEFLK